MDERKKNVDDQSGKQKGRILTAEELAIGYPEKRVAGDISFSLKEGEILVLLGPNGCGKSTLLKTLSGELAPVSGRAVFEEKDPRTGKTGQKSIYRMSPGERARRVSLVTPQKNIRARLTVREVILLGRYPYMDHFLKEKESDRLALERAMDLTGTRDLEDSLVDRLSDGQRQRVAIARAFCQDTRLILLDEPMSFLDLHYQIRLIEILKKAAGEEGRTLVIALHDVREAEILADRILCFLPDGVRLLDDPSLLTDDLIRRMYQLEKSQYDALWRG